MPVYSLTDKYSFIIRKYVFGTFWLLIGLVILFKTSHFGYFLVGCLLTLIGAFFLNLRMIKFDDTSVYIGNRTYHFKEINRYSAIEINLICFPCIKVKRNGRFIWYFTDVGQAGLLRILLSEIFPTLDPLKSIKLFLTYYELHKRKKG